MRILTLIFTFTLAVTLSITSAFLTWHARKALSEPLTLFAEYFPVWIQNRTSNSMPLYRSKIPFGKPIGQLPSGDVYKFQYAGDSGEWLYGVYEGRSVLVKDPNRQKVILVADTYIPIHWLSYGYLTIPVWFFLFFGVMRIRSKEPLESKKVQLVEQEYLAEIESLKEEREEQCRQLENLRAEQDERTRRLKADFEREVEALNKQFEVEVQKVELAARECHEITVTDMQTSFDLLNNQYQTLRKKYAERKAECLFFDVNFDSDKYENLLKGRRFEIFFAKSVTRDPDFKILEWTSDKGFEQGIYVASNGHPDFVFVYQDNFKIAIECKYRSKAVSASDDLYSWGSSYQIQRYSKFGSERKIKVLLALGICGNPQEPESCYLAEISHLKSRSTLHEFNNRQQQYVVSEGAITDYGVCQATVAQALRQYIRKVRGW